jgi:multidrug efflux system outer membrane protein
MPRIPPGLPSSLLERRPDIASAERQLAAANARIGVAVAAFFPVIRLTGAAGFESADMGDLFDWQSRMWQIGPSITFPLFEGGRNLANLRAAQSRYREQVDTYRQQVLLAFQDVENSLADLHTLSDQADAQQRAVAAADRALQLSQSEYDKGAINFLDVLDAERTLLSDERISVQLLGQQLQATVFLIKALGGTW